MTGHETLTCAACGERTSYFEADDPATSCPRCGRPYARIPVGAPISPGPRHALSPKQWADLESGRLPNLGDDVPLTPETLNLLLKAPAPGMAIANHALPAEDPRKLTWELFDALAEASTAEVLRAGDQSGSKETSPLARKLLALQFALFTLLPPRTKG